MSGRTEIAERVRFKREDNVCCQARLGKAFERNARHDSKQYRSRFFESRAGAGRLKKHHIDAGG